MLEIYLLDIYHETNMWWFATCSFVRVAAEVLVSRSFPSAHKKKSNELELVKVANVWGHVDKDLLPEVNNVCINSQISFWESADTEIEVKEKCPIKNGWKKG